MKIKNMESAEDLITTIDASLKEAREKGMEDGAELVAVYLLDNHFPDLSSHAHALGRLNISPERYKEIQNF